MNIDSLSEYVKCLGSRRVRALINFVTFFNDTNIVNTNIKKYKASMLCIIFGLFVFKDFSS